MSKWITKLPQIFFITLDEFKIDLDPVLNEWMEIRMKDWYRC